MNPFQINTSYNKELNSLLAKITKKSSTTKLKALKTLKDNLTTLDIENNMNDVLKVLVPLLDNETEIKAIATDLLYRISTIYKNHQFVEPIIPKLILLAIEENNKSFLKVYNVNVYFDVLVNMISYENNLIVYYKILVYALKCNLMKQEIDNILVRDAHLYNYKSTTELKYISVILSYNKESALVKDAFIEHIKSIKTSNCISNKWQILSVIYKYFDNQMLIDDSKFIDIETLKVIENDKITWECYKPKNIEVFLYVYPKVEDKNKFLFEYIADQKRRSENLKFNLLDLCKDFSILNESIEFEQMNVILKYIRDNDLWTIDKKNALKGLTEEQKIERAYIIGYTLDYQPDIKVADANINMAVHVLPVQYFADNIDKFKNQHEIFTKYPGLITLEYIKTIIYVKEKLCEYLPAITDSEVQEYIKDYMTKYYKTEDYIYICDRISIPDYLQLLFCFNLYNIKEIEINTIEAKTIINEYFNIDFVIYLLQNGKLNLNNFIYELYVILGKIKINNSIVYNHEFYYINSFFYQNIQYTPFDTQTSEYLLFIKETLEKIQSIKPGNNSLIFLIMTINEILGIEQKDVEIEITERVKNNLLASLSVFCIKVLFDLERRFLITLDDINEILIGFDTFDCEYLDYKLGKELRDENVKCYLNLHKKDQITQKDIAECLSLKNARLHNFLIEKLPFDQYKDDVQIVFSREQSLETQMNSITLETKSCIYLEDTNYLSITALKNVFQYCDDYRNYMPVLNALRNDYAWDCSCYKSKERRDILNELLEPIYQQISLEFIDIYSLTRFEENADENEIFALMTSNINFSNLLKTYPLFAWNVFLRSLHLLRNINIIFFIEKMIRNYDFDTIDDELQAIYNFNFPNIGTNKQSLAKLIEHELNHKINNMAVTLLKKATGYILKASYIYEESTFECKLELDNINIKKTTFETTVFQKDLLTIKIRSLLQKCHKYMEILCIWKINIDNKMQGMKECLICYLTVDENMFPDYECKTCANKFHKKCLSKWADKSANFTCPLCRGKFR